MERNSKKHPTAVSKTVGGPSSTNQLITEDNGRLRSDNVRLVESGVEQAIEITRRLGFNTELMAEQARVVEILESINDAFYALSRDGNFTYINRRAADLWGKERNILIGKNIWEVFPQAVGTELYDRISHAAESRTPDHFETFSRIIDRWVEVSVYPTESGLSIYFRDIHERRQAEEALRESEEKFRILSNTAPALIWFDDAEGNCRYVNQQFIDFYGKSEAEFEGAGWQLVIHPDDSEDYISDFQAAQAERRPFHHRARVQRHDGEWRWIESYAQPLFAADGTFLGHVGVSPDITASVEAEEELRLAHENLEARVIERTRDLDRANEELRHEIRDRRKAEEDRISLLRKIVTTQEDERRRIARDLHDQLGQRLTALRLKIASLKDACQEYGDLCTRVDRLAELGEQLDSEVNFLAWELRPAALDDLGVVAAVENYVSEWSAHFEITADFHSSGLKKKRLDSDIETNIYRIAQEALNNVFKHAGAKSVSVILELRKNEIVLIVEDDGVGFETDKIGQINPSGTGLGLVGMRERAAIVGGSIEFESAPRKGTTLIIRIPAVFAGGLGRLSSDE